MLLHCLPGASRLVSASSGHSINTFTPSLALPPPHSRAVFAWARQTPPPSPHATEFRSPPQTAAVVLTPAYPISKPLLRLPPAEKALLLIGFILCTVVVTVSSFVAISLPTIFAARRASISLDKLSKIARSEIPGTMASIRLSGIEINDLTQQLNGLRSSLHEMSRISQKEGKSSEAGKNKSCPGVT